MDNWFADAFPCVGNQQVVDTAVRKRQRGKFDNIDQHPRLDDFAVIRRIERISAPLLRQCPDRMIFGESLRHHKSIGERE